MNKTITNNLIAGLACVAFCGIPLAHPLAGGHPAGAAMGGAPHGGDKAPQNAAAHQPAPARNGSHAPNAGHAPANHGHHVPASAPQHHEQPPPPPPEHHHGGHDCGTGWLALGAAAIGGVIGRIVGPCH